MALKTRGDSFIVLEARSPNSRCCLGHIPSVDFRRRSVLLSSSFGSPGCSLGGGGMTPISTSVFTWSSPLCVCLHIVFSSVCACAHTYTCVSKFPSQQMPAILDQEPTPLHYELILTQLIISEKALFFKQGHILSY